MNWVSIVIIAVIAALIDFTLSAFSQNKNKQEFMKELYKIEDLKTEVEFIRNFLIGNKKEG